MQRLLFTVLFITGLYGVPFLQQVNIVPNPGFEDYVDVPDRWYYNGEHFTEIVKFWSSPTPASPDAYGPEIIVPKEWKQKGFGAQAPRSGNNKVGLTIFGCGSSKPHCREYIQIRLKELLVPGQKYELSLWVSHLESSLYSNNLGFVFTETELYHDLDVPLNIAPLINETEIVKPSPGSWQNLVYIFTADKAYEFMAIGNFFSDAKTLSFQSLSNKLPFAYYYIDDIDLHKLEPMIPVPEEINSLEKIRFETGSKIHLEKIYFDYDRADFLPRSFVQLEALYSLMVQNEDLFIEVHGHTDNTGTDLYNQGLSLERAKAVVDYLAARGIGPDRVMYKGFGSTQPIESNHTFEGRSKNRRVEFLILGTSNNN